MSASKTLRYCIEYWLALQLISTPLLFSCYTHLCLYGGVSRKLSLEGPQLHDKRRRYVIIMGRYMYITCSDRYLFDAKFELISC